MAKIVHCSKLKQKLEGLEEAPFPGPLGEKIHKNISKQAWDLWIEQQTILINENKLQLFKKEARDFLKEEARRFFFKADQ